MRKGKKVRKRFYSLYIYFALVLLSIAIFSLLRSACDSLRDDLVNALMKEKILNEENVALKTEIGSISHERFLTLLANENLGLKKAREKEVYVLK